MKMERSYPSRRRNGRCIGKTSQRAMHRVTVGLLRICSDWPLGMCLSHTGILQTRRCRGGASHAHGSGRLCSRPIRSRGREISKNTGLSYSLRRAGRRALGSSSRESGKCGARTTQSAPATMGSRPRDVSTVEPIMKLRMCIDQALRRGKPLFLNGKPE